MLEHQTKLEAYIQAYNELARFEKNNSIDGVFEMTALNYFEYNKLKENLNKARLELNGDFK